MRIHIELSCIWTYVGVDLGGRGTLLTDPLVIAISVNSTIRAKMYQVLSHNVIEQRMSRICRRMRYQVRRRGLMRYRQWYSVREASLSSQVEVSCKCTREAPRGVVSVGDGQEALREPASAATSVGKRLGLQDENRSVQI